MGNAVVVFITVPSAKEGRKLGSILVRKKLAACVNRVPGIHSTYWWKGKIDKAREELLMLKTMRSKMPALIKEVKRVHSYTVPEIIAVPIAQGNADYLKWICSSLK